MLLLLLAVGLTVVAAWLLPLLRRHPLHVAGEQRLQRKGVHLQSNPTRQQYTTHTAQNTTPHRVSSSTLNSHKIRPFGPECSEAK